MVLLQQGRPQHQKLKAPGTGFVRGEHAERSLDSGSVTVMITAKGSVIIQLAWRNSITWSEQVSRQTLNACNVACFVVENCC